MNVQLNPIINKYNYVSFKKSVLEQYEKENSSGSFSKDEITLARTKKVISELKYIALGVIILYFAMKKNIKINNLKKEAEKAKKLADLEKPVTIDFSALLKDA